MLLLFLALLLIPSTLFAACFTIAMMRTFTRWTGVHWAAVIWGLSFFLWALPLSDLLGAFAEGIAPRRAGAIATIGMVAIPSCVTAFLLGMATRSPVVAALTLGAGAVSALILSAGGVPDVESEIAALASWQIIVCASLIAWSRSVRRAKPWFGRPLTCKRCGYNMAGLREPVCPECGTNLLTGSSATERPPMVVTGVPRVGERKP